MNRYIDATDLTEQIAKFKRAVNSPNSDYMTGYLSALSVTEGMIANTPTADVAPIADTVRKMQNRFSSLLGEEYRKYAPEGADQYFKNGAYMMRAIADRLIILIAKEMLEGENGTTIC